MKEVEDQIQPEKKGIIKLSLEKIFGRKLGDNLDDYFMKMFEKYNKRRYSKYDSEEFKLAFKSSKKESKHHPKSFQKKVIEEFNKKIKVIEEELQVSLR